MTVADLYAIEHKRILSWLAKRVNSLDLAEDILQDAWIRCLQAEQRGQPVEVAYVFRAAASIVTDRWRRRQSVREAPLLDDCPIASLSTSPEDAYVRAELLDDVFTSMRSKRQRDALWLFSQGYRHAEIAKQLGISIDGCKTRLVRAHKHARAVRAA